jgi:hypothetical protein
MATDFGHKDNEGVHVFTRSPMPILTALELVSSLVLATVKVVRILRG